MLDQNFPNPFNPATTISFTLARRGKVSLTVYNAVGEIVATLVDEELGEGLYAVPFDAQGLASGMYFYRLQTPTYMSTKRMVLTK